MTRTVTVIIYVCCALRAWRKVRISIQSVRTFAEDAPFIMRFRSRTSSTSTIDLEIEYRGSGVARGGGGGGGGGTGAMAPP